MGSGRTELALSLFGMTRPSRGDILLDGKPVQFVSNQDAIDAGIAYVSEDRLNLGLVQTQSIVKNTAATVLDDLAQPFYWLSPARIRALCDHWIDQLKTKVSNPDLPVNSLSGGNQQKVVLGRWLATNRTLLVCEDPPAGVDVGAKAEIYALLTRALGDGVAILIMSTDFEEIATICHRAVVFSQGAIVDELSGTRLTTENLIQSASAGNIKTTGGGASAIA